MTQSVMPASLKTSSTCFARSRFAYHFRIRPRSRFFTGRPRRSSAVRTPRHASLTGLWSTNSVFQIASAWAFFDIPRNVSYGRSEYRKNSAIR
jgi:hypothetical protein